jgi:hypothetical protein
LGVERLDSGAGCNDRTPVELPSVGSLAEEAVARLYIEIGCVRDGDETNQQMSSMWSRPSSFLTSISCADFLAVAPGYAPPHRSRGNRAVRTEFSFYGD